MPQLYLIVRFESTNISKPSYWTHDITITGLPIVLADDDTRTVETYTVIDEQASDGPWTYRIAVEVIKMTGKGLHISYGTMSRDDAMQSLQNIPKYVKESDKERLRSGGDHSAKAKIRWFGQTCVRIQLREKSFCWYEMVSADVVDRATFKAIEEDVAGGGDRKRQRTEVEAAVGEDMDVFGNGYEGEEEDKDVVDTMHES